jgi:hypothetical protein
MANVVGESQDGAAPELKNVAPLLASELDPVLHFP